MGVHGSLIPSGRHLLLLAALNFPSLSAKPEAFIASLWRAGGSDRKRACKAEHKRPQDLSQSLRALLLGIFLVFLPFFLYS
jgi:hypothetical protein